jgi:putative membrane protein
MADMLAEIRQGHLAQGLAAGVRDVGVVLAEHFPRGADDANEIPDRLIVV